MQILFLCIDRYQNNGLPFYLVEICGKTLIEYQLKQFRHSFPQAVFHVAVDDPQQAKIINSIAEQANINLVHVHVLPKGTKGAASSALFVTASLAANDEIFIVSTNEFVNTDLRKVREYYKEKCMRGGLISFESHVPKYSFIESENEEVIGVYQYDAISGTATAGLFWFESIGEFCDAAKQMIMKGESYNGNYYIGPCFNEMILQGKKIGRYQIKSDAYCPLKNDNDLIQSTLTLVNIMRG